VKSAEIQRYAMYIGGHNVVAERQMEVVNPYSGAVWATVPEGGAEHVDAAVTAARKAFEDGPWCQMTGTERGHLLRRLGDIIKRDAELLARLETDSNGKLYKEMVGQWNYLPEFFYFYGGMADKIAGHFLNSDKKNFHVFTKPEPVGVVGAITAWNSPGLLLVMKLAAGLAAGCTFVAKPSEFTPISTIELGKRFKEAGFPDGVFNVVTGAGAVGAALVNHPGVDKIAFTGAAETGKRIAASAAANMTRVSLELGGKSPNIIFEDADLNVAINGAVAGIFGASGQTCMAGSRLLLQESIHDAFVEKLAVEAKKIRLGNPMDPDTQMGPIANAPQYRKVLDYIEVAKKEGAVLCAGGVPARQAGELFIEPTIFSGVNNNMRIAREEVFGPVLTIIPFKDEDDAIRIANDTRFGLAAAVWTQNVHRAHRVAGRLRAGTVWINAYRVVSYVAPFGGFGESGLGRENGLDAIKEFTENKSIFVELSGKPRDPFQVG
jgi:(Z)-2-((N-methylformamido)methylene)-5-hydroxybutyrolactone dehydrogenase